MHSLILTENKLQTSYSTIFFSAILWIENTVLPWRQNAKMGPTNSLPDATKEIKKFYASGAKSPQPGVPATVRKGHFVKSCLANKYFRDKRSGATRWRPPIVHPKIDL